MEVILEETKIPMPPCHWIQFHWKKLMTDSFMTCSKLRKRLYNLKPYSRPNIFFLRIINYNEVYFNTELLWIGWGFRSLRWHFRLSFQTLWNTLVQCTEISSLHAEFQPVEISYIRKSLITMSAELQI